MVLVVTTESGTSYEVDNENMRVRRLGGAEMRKDGEWLGLKEQVEPIKGKSMRLVLEPLADSFACVFTMRVTSKVVSIDRRVMQ